MFYSEDEDCTCSRCTALRFFLGDACPVCDEQHIEHNQLPLTRGRAYLCHDCGHQWDADNYAFETKVRAWQAVDTSGTRTITARSTLS